MKDFLELQKFRNLAGVTDKCPDCGNTNDADGFKATPVLIPGADLKWRPDGHARLVMLVCKRCGTATFVDPSVFRISEAQAPNQAA